MRLTAILGCIAVAAACTAKESAPPPDTTAAAPPAPTVSLGHLAGVWNVTVKPADKDTVVATYILNTTDTADWTFMFPKGKPIHQEITGYRGDTIVSETDWFDSAVRPGLKVKTNSLTWEQDSKLMSNVTAHYQNAGADSVRQLISEGIRQ
jgi:hypothetical protein